jgi:hypothetical protein
MTTTPDPPPVEARRQFRRTLVRVLAVQVITVLLLWLLHARYHG